MNHFQDFPGTPLAVALGALLLLAACSKVPQTEALPRPVRVQSVTLTAPDWRESFTGSVHAHVESELAFRVGGKLIRRTVDVGQRVRTGDVIAEIDAQDYELELDAATHEQQAAAVDAEQAASDAERFSRLLAHGAVSQGDAERQRARADAARERLDQARRHAELARNRAGYSVLRAPFDGVITALRIEVGQVVAEGHVVASIAAGGEREIIVDIPESRVLQARRMPIARATLWSGGDKPFAVALRELAPEAWAATRTYRSRYRVGADAPAMELGMTATVWLGTAAAGATAERVATLPASALFHAAGHAALWTIPKGETRPRLVPVQVVRYGEDQVQVTGVKEGEYVVTAGVQKLAPGMNVIAVDADGQPMPASAAELAAVDSNAPVGLAAASAVPDPANLSALATTASRVNARAGHAVP